MKLAGFFQRFREDQEIGRDVTDERLEVYYDNGQSVGRVVHDKRSTCSHAELLNPDHAAAARDWCRRQRENAQAAPACRIR